MTTRQSYIITTAEDVDVNDIADDKLGKIIKGAKVQDAVNLMATAHIPQEEDVLTIKEFNIATASLTDAEATKLSHEKGIQDVELDEEVYAINDSDEALLMEPEHDSEFFFEGQAEQEDETLDFGLGDTTPLFDADISDETLAHQAELELIREKDDSPMIDFDSNGHLIMPEAEIDKIVAELSQLDNVTTPSARSLVTGLVNEFQQDLRTGVSPESFEQKVTDTIARLAPELVAAIPTDYITYGLRMIWAPLAWRYTKGAIARVAVVDTGISRNHSDLRVRGGASFVPGVTSWNDDQGHGTHVAGTIAALMNGRGVVGVAPDARLYAVKVLNSRGSGRMSWIINGLVACYRARMNVCNLSLGSLATTHNPNSYSRAYERVGRLLRRRGILAVAAAGNSGRTRSPYVGNPARCPSFMAVSAVDNRRRRAAFSSYGPQVEITAPGVNIWSTTNNGGYGQKSGTSMAAPHVSGVAALNKSRRPYLSGEQIRQRIKATAVDVGNAGRDPFYGYGLVNAYRSVR